jgi:hypothetical protein
MANDISRVGSDRSRATGLPTPPPSPRANSNQTPRNKGFGWVPPAAQKSDPAGTPYTPFGPGTPAWAATGKRKK